MQSITLIKPDGGELVCRFAPFTGSRMDALEKVAEQSGGNYYTTNKLFDAVEINPEIIDKPEFADVRQFVEKFVEGKETKEQAITAMLKLAAMRTTAEERAQHALAYRKFVQIMILETVLSEDDLKLVKSDVESAFWGGQDWRVIKDAGEFFRHEIIEHQNAYL